MTSLTTFTLANKLLFQGEKSYLRLGKFSLLAYVAKIYRTKKPRYCDQYSPPKQMAKLKHLDISYVKKDTQKFADLWCVIKFCHLLYITGG